jgi:hypothetical protein
LTGYISCFQLDDIGAIQKRLFKAPTTTTNGIANSVTLAPLSDEWMALADNNRGCVCDGGTQDESYQDSTLHS